MRCSTGLTPPLLATEPRNWSDLWGSLNSGLNHRIKLRHVPNTSQKAWAARRASLHRRTFKPTGTVFQPGCAHVVTARQAAQVVALVTGWSKLHEDSFSTFSLNESALLAWARALRKRSKQSGPGCGAGWAFGRLATRSTTPSLPERVLAGRRPPMKLTQSLKIQT